MTSTHVCPAAGCTTTVPFGRFACSDHWFSLPPELRTRITRTWRAQDLPAWLDARQEAVALLGGQVEAP